MPMSEDPDNGRDSDPQNFQTDADKNSAARIGGTCESELPDLSIMRLNRRPPPALPLDVFGRDWGRWIADVATGAACPIDYVVAALLPAASAMIGNARWAQAVPGWREPPHLWCAAVGDSGQGKSPAADIIYRHIVPSIETRMAEDFALRLQEHRATNERNRATADASGEGVILRAGAAHLSKLLHTAENAEPIAPRFVENDLTIERVALVLANAAPKGLLMARDELAGWLLGMNAYNQGARAFWIEAHGGRPYRIDRMKHPEPIVVPHLAVAWHGGIQPARLARVMRDADDGLLARFCFFWPDAVPFRLTMNSPDVDFAVAAFERLGMLEMAPPSSPDGTPVPTCVPLCERGRMHLERFGRDMQTKQELSGGLLVSTLGKARGLVLRLSLVLEHLWWAGKDGMAPAPAEIGEDAFLSAVRLVADYFMPMAERVYGDAVATPQMANAATLARWIVKTKASEVHVRQLQRQVRLPGLGEAALIHQACQALVEAGWLATPLRGSRDGRARAAYQVRPELWEALTCGNTAGGGSFQ